MSLLSVFIFMSDVPFFLTFSPQHASTSYLKSEQCHHHPGKERLLSGAHSGVAGIKGVIFIDNLCRCTYLRLLSPSVFCILGLTYSSISNLSLFSLLPSSCLCLSMVYLQNLSVTFLLILSHLATSWLGLVIDRF
jgi:hypothetical protein